MRRDVFKAIADPTRREILNLVWHRPLHINAVAANFPVSRTAIYKHLKILTECGLVALRRQGRERYCQSRLEGLREVADWVAQYRDSWNDRLDSLEEYLKELQTKPEQ